MRPVDESEIGSAKVLPPEESSGSTGGRTFFGPGALRRGAVASQPAKPVARRGERNQHGSVTVSSSSSSESASMSSLLPLIFVAHKS
jgi:hypothetical protein